MTTLFCALGAVPALIIAMLWVFRLGQKHGYWARVREGNVPPNMRYPRRRP